MTMEDPFKSHLVCHAHIPVHMSKNLDEAKLAIERNGWIYVKFAKFRIYSA